MRVKVELIDNKKLYVTIGDTTVFSYVYDEDGDYEFIINIIDNNIIIEDNNDDE